MLRAIGRGGASRLEAARETAVAERRLRTRVSRQPERTRRARAVIKELTRTAGIGAGIDVAGGAVTGEDVPKSLSGLAAILLRPPAGTRNLLVSSPGFAKWALDTGARPGGFGSKVGVLIALLANEGPEVLAAAREFDALALDEQPQRRTSIGPAAIPPPQWGHRPMPGGVGGAHPVPQPGAQTAPVVSPFGAPNPAAGLRVPCHEIRVEAT